ncbi:MAG TPA: universal stress protein [Azospira sp.]|nr:universal stress protein [Azospira sp.]HNN46885.1 universal stress protein [Azospira sp.]
MQSHASSMSTSPAGARPPIVVATDLSEAARIAVEGAARLTRRQNADLHVLHVFDDGIWATLKNLYDTQHWSGEAPVLGTRRRLSELAADIAHRHGIRALAESEAGDPAEAIVRFASQRGAGLVVIGKDSDDWLSDTLFGETALELLQTTDVPVMIVRRGQAQPARRVLVAVDFSACSHRAARLACELFHEAEITLLNAYSVRHEGRMRIGGASDDDIAAYLLSEQVRAEAAMRQLSSALDNEKCCRTVTVNGSAASAILEEAATGFDVLVVGKTGEGSREHRLGDVATHITYHTDCDVLLVP